MTTYWEEDPDKLNAEIDAAAKEYAEKIRRAKCPNPAQLADKVREQLEAVRQEQILEDSKYVHTKVMELIYSVFGHAVREVPEPCDWCNVGRLPKDWT